MEFVPGFVRIFRKMIIGICTANIAFDGKIGKKRNQVGKSTSLDSERKLNSE